ncbi:MAG: hypothetical protein AAF429_04020, partial [Pseudomonadota bacterium]
VFDFSGELSEAVRTLNEICKAAADTLLNLRAANVEDEATVVFYRLDTRINWKVDAGNSIDFDLTDFFSYCRSRNDENSQYLIYSSNFEHHLESIHSPLSAEDFDTPELLVAEVQKQELLHFVQDTNGLFEHSGRAIFDLPSGDMKDYFLRVGNLQSNALFKHAICFWLFPYLRDIYSVYGDSWSISSLISCIRDTLLEYCGRQVEWHCSTKYMLDSVNRERNSFVSFVNRCNLRKLKLLCLVSFASSGKLIEELKSILDDFKDLDTTYLSFFTDHNCTDEPWECLCNIAEFRSERRLQGDVEGRQTIETRVFTVDNSTYFPNYWEPATRKFTTRRYTNDRYKAFFERYAGKKIFSVHRLGTNKVMNFGTSNAQYRHHSFHVDLERLFSDQAFKYRLTRKISRLKKITHVFSPQTNAGQLLAQNITEYLNNEVVVNYTATHEYKEVLQQERVKDALTSAGDSVIFCVPAVISGDALGQLQIRLREFETKIARITASVQILVGLLRPEAQEKLEDLEELYLKRTDQRANWIDPVVVESVILPNWDSSQCPWKRETNKLTIISQIADLSAHDLVKIESRRDEIDSRYRTGLLDEFVFHTNPKQKLEYNNRGLILSDEKVAGSWKLSTGPRISTEADLCCAVASAIQVWRNLASETAEPSPFVTVDIKTICNLNGFNEARLRAAIWRALTPNELINAARKTSNSQDFVEISRKIFVENDDLNYAPLKFEAAMAFGKEIGWIVKKEATVRGLIAKLLEQPAIGFAPP